ncbi:hypothetical protein I3842_14G134800 [Carya illinoinensis]|uniref:Uncharacterized protein n=1 Tax=Carya illinoinensis TaxID=32201 RepID=A0A922AF83_CARIL|nr:hypothetical protein I3842_14G134800 [Carya illinoinensis]
MAWQAIVSFQDLESYAFFDMDGNQTPQDLVIAGGKHISLNSNSSFYRDSRAKYIIEGIFDKLESLHTSVVIFGGEILENSMGLQVLLDKNLAPQTFDVLPLKVVFRPFDRGRERTPVGINCDDQDVVDELGMGSNGGWGALRWLGVLIGREFSVEDLLIILDKIFASVNG